MESSRRNISVENGESKLRPVRKNPLYPALFCNWPRGVKRQIIGRGAPAIAPPAIAAAIVMSQENA